MKGRRILSFLLCLMLVSAIFPSGAYAEGEEKEIVFELFDGTTRERIPGTAYSSGEYELCDSSEQPIEVTVTSETVSALLTVEESYHLKVSIPGYYTSNEEFTVQTDSEFVQVFLSKKADITLVPESAISSVVIGGETPAIDVSIIAGNLPEGLESDQFSIVLMPDMAWDVESDGIPLGMWEAPPEPMENDRHENVDPGEYTLFVGFFKTIDRPQEEGGWYRALVGYSTKVVNVEGPPEEGQARVTISVSDPILREAVEGASVRLTDGNNEFTGIADVYGNVRFTLVVDCNYEVQVEMDGYYKTNERFKASAEGGPIQIHVYQRSGESGLTVVPDSAISASVHEHGAPGVDVSILAEELGKLPGNFTPDEFAVLLIRGMPWNVETDGLPPEILQAPPESLDATRYEDIGLDGDSEEVVIFVAFYDKVIGEHGEHSELTGYAVTSAVITQVQDGGGPGGGPGPGARGPLVFECASTNPEITESVEIEFDTHIETYSIPLPDSTAGSITFPSEFDGKSLTLMDLNTPFWVDFSLDSFGGSIEGNVLSYTQPFKRIRLFAELEGEPRPYEFIFCQPGYEAFDLKFSLNDGEKQYVMPQDGTWKTRFKSFELPPSLQSGTIKATVHWPDEIENEEDIGPVGGGIWEYLVDRSDYITHTNVDDGCILTFQRHFGKVTIHYQFQVGYSWEDAMVTFYEPDFVGIDVFPEVGAGDWHTGIIDASEYSMLTLTPTAYVYFLNEKVFISPSGIGRPFEIMSVTSSEEGVEATYEEVSFDTWAWAVTLPDITKPVTRLNLELSFHDDGTTRVVPLDIKRVLLDAFTLEYEEPFPEAGLRTTPRQTDFEYYGYEEFITFVSVTSFTETYLEDPYYFEIDHTLLVIYYKDDVLLGARQFPASADPGWPRVEIPVYRKGAPEYADVTSANRVTAFLITKEGISADDSTFGGTVFGVGAGWGHLMPNHAEYGSGKDGMDYE